LYSDRKGVAPVPARTYHSCHSLQTGRVGLDPDRLAYFYSGLDQKLVGVEGAELIRAILA
jgi:hypothetical protein